MLLCMYGMSVSVLDSYMGVFVCVYDMSLCAGQLRTHSCNTMCIYTCNKEFSIFE